MVEIISIVFFSYILLKIYISVMQIGYVAKEKEQEPFLLSQKDYILAGNYTISKERLNIVSAILEGGLFLFWLDFGLQYFDEVFQTDYSHLKTIYMIGTFMAITWIFNLPFEIYQKFVIDEKFGFNNSSFKLFIIDNIKSIFLSAVIGLPLIFAITYFIDNYELWWLYSFLSLFGIMIFINMIYPTLIAPMFNKMEPLKNIELEESIKKLLDKVGFQTDGIFTIDASKRDSRLNAYFGGFGKTKRVVLFDTLIEKLTTQEILAVLGHELGHFKHGDVYKNLILIGILLFSAFYFLGNIPQEFFNELGVEKRGDTLIILFFLLTPVLTMVIMPIFGLVSRHNEFEADKMGAELSGNKLFLKNALKKLVIENRAFPKSHKIFIFFYYSHPPIYERLQKLD